MYYKFIITEKVITENQNVVISINQSINTIR